MSENKRFKVAIGAAAMGVLCGVLKALWTSYPIVEVFAFVGPVLAYYFTVQTVTDNAKIKSNNQ